MKRKLMKVGYGVMIISSVALIIFMLEMINYLQQVGRDYEDEKYLLIFGLAGVVLVGWFSYFLYKRKCEKFILKVIRNFFFIILYLATLVTCVAGAIWSGVEAYECKERADELMEKKKEIQKVADALKSDDIASAEQAMLYVYNHKLLSEWSSYNGWTYLELSAPWNSYSGIHNWFMAELRRWVEQGSNEAEFLLGELYYGFYENNHSRNEKGERAFYWWSKAAEHGNAKAYMRMAQCYEGTISLYTLQENKKIASEWYIKAAAEGNSDAWYKLGNMLIEINKVDAAKKCWRKAAEMGNEDAKSALEMVYSTDVQPGAKKENPGTPIKW